MTQHLKSSSKIPIIRLKPAVVEFSDFFARVPMKLNLFSIFYIIPTVVAAQQCTSDYLTLYLTKPNPDKLVYATADQADGNYDFAEFYGGVEIKQGDKYFLTDHALYQHNKGEGKIPQTGIFATPSVVIKGKEGTFNLQEQTASFLQADYLLKKNDANGSAKNIYVNNVQKIDRLENATWTTCERINPTWNIAARNLVIDRNENMAYAKNVTFRIKNTPIFYLPFFSYPIDSQRHSGFLLPNIRSSDIRGLEVNIPYYWNISPNQDAILSFAPMTKLGAMTSMNYRYLTQHWQGSIGGQYLIGNDKRWSIKTNHLYSKNDLKINVSFQQVSDINFVNDFNNNLYTIDDWFLNRYLDISYKNNWLFRIQDYQIISKNVNDQPYSKLPQISYTNYWENDGLIYNLRADAIKFYKNNSLNGERYHLNTSVEYPIQKEFGFIKPKIILNTTYYNLNNFENKKRILPTLSFDSGLIFGKQLGKYIQTLEPRLFYVYTPYKNQKDFPLFDTSRMSYRWDNLFRENIYIGDDRIINSNRLTTAISTRLINNQTGKEKLQLSIGSLNHFNTPKVNLYGNENLKNLASLIVSEADFHINDNWDLYNLNFYNRKAKKNENNIFNLRYRYSTDNIISLTHRFNRNIYNQISLNSIWRINEKWRTFYRQDYSFNDKKIFNTVIGAEYNDCCWAWRLSGKHYRIAPEDKHLENSIYLEFIFKGLGNIGNNLNSLLQDEINGFNSLDKEK